MWALDGVIGGDVDVDGIDVDWANSTGQEIAGVGAFSVTCRSGALKRLRLTVEERFLLLSSLRCCLDCSNCVDSISSRWFGGCCAFGALRGEGESGSTPKRGDPNSDSDDCDWSAVCGGVVVNNDDGGFSIGWSFFGDEINRDFIAGSGL